jgi:hypothetical protein
MPNSRRSGYPRNTRLKSRPRGGVAKNLRVIELSPIGIRVGPKDLTDRIPQPRPCAPDTAPKIAGVLVKESRVNCLGHVGANDEVRVRCAKVAGVSSPTFSERWISVGELSVSGERRSQNHGTPVE